MKLRMETEPLIGADRLSKLPICILWCASLRPAPVNGCSRDARFVPVAQPGQGFPLASSEGRVIGFFVWSEGVTAVIRVGEC
jgi:hypothetical protein